MDYDWRCQACDSSVSAGNSECPTCGCPASCSQREVAKHKEKYLNSEEYRNKQKYRCTKCDHHFFIKGFLRGPGGGVTAALDVATESFSYISCSKCGYTEFYKIDLSGAAFVLDVLMSN